jgi:hypothetical protein
MRTLILILLFTTLAFGQKKSAYNAGQTLPTTPRTNSWTYDLKTKMEILFYDQTPVGYAKSMKEIGKVLDFYGILYANTFEDNTVISNIATIDDYNAMSTTLFVEYSEVHKIWKTETLVIQWYCNKDFNTVSIMTY